MMIEELKEAWKSQETRRTVETVMLLESVRERHQQISRDLFWRNLREGWITILAAVYFAAFTESDAPRDQLWLFYLAMVVLAGVGIFRVRDNIRQNQEILSYGDSALSFIGRSLHQIRHRIWLMKNMLWWWIIPVSVCGLLIVLQILWLADGVDSALCWILLRGIGIACLVLGALYVGNQLTVTKYWQPRQSELEDILDTLKNAPESDETED